MGRAPSSPYNRCWSIGERSDFLNQLKGQSLYSATHRSSRNSSQRLGQAISIPIMLANKGTRHHRLLWSTTEESQVLQKSGKHEQRHDKFTVDPHDLELPAGTNAIVHCKIHWQTKEPIAEQWYLHGQIKGYGRSEVLATSLFRATFIDPHVIFSKRKLMFRYDMSASENEIQTTDELYVTNRSKLDLRASLKIDPPFEIVTDDEGDGLANTNIDLRDETPNRICVRFNTQAMNPLNLYSRKFNGILTFQYENHRVKDKIKCIAELNYPNISILPNNLAVLNSDVGSTAYKNLILANPGHLPVRYYFEYLADDNIGIESSHYDHARCLQSSETTAGKSSFRDFSPSEVQEAEQEAKDKEDPENNLTSYLFERSVPEITKLAIPSSGSVDDLVYTIGGTAQRDKGDKERRYAPAVTLPPVRSLELIDIDNTKEKDHAERLAPAKESEIQDLIFGIIERHLRRDSEIPALEDAQKATTDISLERELMTEMLEVVPRCGTILPYSSQYVYFDFNALSRVGFNANVACRLLSGPTEVIEVQALCDAISFSIDTKKIDFYHQLPWESCRASLTIVNQGVVGFNFATYLTPALSSNVESRELVEGTERGVNVDRLRVEPRRGSVNPMSRTYLDITYYSGIPGRIRERFDLEIAHYPPVSICIEGYVSAPQVYLSIPRGMAFNKLPVNICYRAIASITVEFLNQVKSTRRSSPLTSEGGLSIEDRSQGYSLISDNERQQLTENGWVIITCDETVPTVVDVEMAIERLLFIEYVRDNPQLLEKHDAAIKKRDALSLLVPEYVIDLGYIVVEQTACFSTLLFNYGPILADIRIRKPLNKFGIYVQFDQGKPLPIGESTPLNVTFNPTRSKYTEQETIIEHTIYLEVSHGSTIPISIKATVAYPSLTVHTNYLSFGQVAVGNCMLIPVLLRNSGWVPCEWQATIRYKDSGRWKEGTAGPFFLHYSADTFLPGSENLANVYFKPKEAVSFI
ncbi:hydrocephalus-inducing protein homolog isoform X1 [Neodiprion fabricii]|uniref:hydrocephalus-inducing protein homolog isoform X1 n=1 Tax=Neodiprion fabricii TaxID=2872261 RepID=UPI001ED91E28|nr:hydrocephalus-inducing protein homolog isoform X1 [Neodiprion fabricii]XP_046429305.1 hydrocephalus-inducing protein homolog isoform X1 [Neodiprion fabricii]XP_046429316.1 hydrocephalus-inducing protein homolog isoform X1 [Neodiprion fabricii]